MDQEYRRRLEAERRRLARMSRALVRSGLRYSLRDSVGELSSYDNHPADLGDETFERGKDYARRMDLDSFIAEVDDALDRLDRGTYGTCEGCGADIDEERLRAVPSARYCRACAERRSGALSFSRPAEEDLLSVPFHRTFTDDSPLEKVGFDGEDSWQSVARWGSSDGPQDAGGAPDYDHVYVDADEDRGDVYPRNSRQLH